MGVNLQSETFWRDVRCLSCLCYAVNCLLILLKETRSCFDRWGWAVCGKVVKRDSALEARVIDYILVVKFQWIFIWCETWKEDSQKINVTKGNQLIINWIRLSLGKLILTSVVSAHFGHFNIVLFMFFLQRMLNVWMRNLQQQTLQK